MVWFVPIVVAVTLADTGRSFGGRGATRAERCVVLRAVVAVRVVAPAAEAHRSTPAATPAVWHSAPGLPSIQGRSGPTQ